MNIAADPVRRFLGWVDSLGIWAPMVFVLGYAVTTVVFVPGSLHAILNSPRFPVACTSSCRRRPRGRFGVLCRSVGFLPRDGNGHQDCRHQSETEEIHVFALPRAKAARLPMALPWNTPRKAALGSAMTGPK